MMDRRGLAPEGEARQAERPIHDVLRLAYEQIRSLRVELAERDAAASEPIAVVGMGCRFPGGARDAASLWRVLRDGVDAVGTVPRARFDADALYDPDPDAPGKILSRSGAFIEDVDCFDSELFGISPLEAANMDPQQRVLLEVVWEALEDAGYDPLGLSGSRTGVYVGMMYQDHYARQLREMGRDEIGAYLGTGATFSAAAGRVSYVLGLQGPSIVVDTACSSSLVSVHLACQALRNNECDIALAGGVNVMLVAEPTINLSRARMISPSGRCRTFDAAADGYTRGEGCGVIVLKRLSAAEADGDRILGLVRGSAVNQDGRSNGFTAPSGAAQRAVFRDALAAAGVTAADVGYVECHGTGTPLGDPIEVGSIGDVYGDRPAERPLALGAVKTNFGHLESAAGICGVIKALLVLQHGEIPPSLHLRELNPKIRLSGRPIQIPTAPTPWFGNGPRLAAVNAFGFVGTNAQVILEAAPVDMKPARPITGRDDVADVPGELPRGQHWVLPLSATGPDVLDALCTRYADRLAQARRNELADICFTASTGRAHLPERVAIVAADAAEMSELLREGASGRSARVLRGHAPREAVRPVLLFTGQGSQHAGTGRRLYASQPRFRDALDHCCEVLREQVGLRLTDLLFAEPGSAQAALLDQTRYTQPALVALQLALLELWRHWGVEPAAVLGHSVGEISAAAAAGVLTPEDALRLAAIRGSLMQELPPGGGMAVVFAPASWARQAVAAFPETLAVAGFNAPGENVISGRLEDLLVVIERAKADGIEVKRLSVSHAFHSPLMRPMVARLRSALAGISMQAPVVPLVSNLTGRFVTPDHIAQPDYWCEHVLAPVRFEDSVRTLAAAGYTHALELGPQPTLAGLAMQTVPELTACPALRRGRDDDETACLALARLHVDGVAIDWRAVHAGSDRHRTEAPHYPFRRERHWLYPEEDRRPVELAGPRGRGSELLLGERVDVVGAPTGTQTWEVDADFSRRRYLREHALLGRAIWPVSAQIELALEAARAGLSVDCCEIEDIELVRTLYAEDPAAQRIQVQLEQRPGGSAALSIHARRAGDDAIGWQLHTRAQVRLRRDGAVQRSEITARDEAPAVAARTALEFSMMFFAAIESDEPADRYALILEAARRGDAAGFGAVWVPERHFTPMGSLYPNPSVLHAALARETRRIHLRAGSVVLPLHHPIRIAEEWAMVDNLSGGRIGISLAPGWNPADFLLASGNYEDRYRDLYDGVGRVRALWRGEPVVVDGANGTRTEVRVYPTPLQKELPLWITAARNPESFRQAGALGTHLLTHLLDQDVDALAEKIAIYRAARAEHGHDPASGRVTVMCHTFVAGDIKTVRRVARKPFCDYLKASKPLLRGLAESRGQDFDIDALSDADMEAFVGFLYERFEGTRALFGTPDSCLDMTLRLRAAGVDEIACLLDFGLGDQDILAHLPQLAALRDLHEQACARETPAVGIDAAIATDDGALPQQDAFVDLTAAQQRCPVDVPVADFYRDLAARGVELTGSLQVLSSITVGEGRAIGRLLGRVRGSQAREVGAPFIDGCLQTALAALLHHVKASDPDGIFVPTRVGSVQLHRPVAEWPEDDINAAARIARGSAGSLSGSVIALDANGQPLLSIRDLVVERLKTEAAEDEIAQWGYEVSWRASQAAAASAAAPPLATCENWIVLADTRGVADAWLSATVGRPLCVRRFEQQADQPLGDPFAWLDALDLKKCPGILCLWPLDTPPISELDGETVLAEQSRGVATIVALVQAVARRAGCPTRIFIGTSDAQAVRDDDAVAGCAHASLWGMAAAVAREHPRLWGGIVDLDPKATPAKAAAGIAALLRAAPGEDQIALRGGASYVRRLVRAPLRPAVEEIGVSGDGAYLIAGGLGGLGLAVARWLVEQGARHLLLLARSVRDADDPLIADLTARGATVDYRSVDIGDAAALARILDDWKAAGRPAIRGVIHAAGVFHDQSLEAVKAADVEAGLRAKLVGALALDRALADQPLQFFVLFSSFSSLTPPAGQSVYASACAFLDSLAERRRASGQVALSVAWGAWSDVGFATTAYGQQAHARLAQAGMKRMTPAQGIAVLARLLGHRSPSRIAVLPGDLGLLAEHDSHLAGLPLLRDVLGDKAGRAAPQSAAAAAFLAKLKLGDVDEQRELLASALCNIVGDILKQRRERIEMSRRLTDLGLDSLVAMQFKNRVGRDLGLDVSLVDLLRGASIASLTEALLIGVRVDAVRAKQAPADVDQGREKVRDEFTL
ncbi:MupA/Atu3671 family FMN-dependent luciferase-like monooxygenase [Bradyrhizobium sp. HKCCYLS2038]|uniref:MupA/Atu3671 family FMN-dependent luciferase-like monooxygenase n=1 Tax=unclassified Bradyrhizobium TaxID=2631580 RepID=UPI003EBFBC3A